jgi:hypothetical protein
MIDHYSNFSVRAILLALINVWVNVDKTNKTFDAVGTKQPRKKILAKNGVT